MRIIYNGIDLLPIDTHEYRWEAVYDDSGVDYLYTRVTVLVTAMVNGQISVLGPNPPGPAGMGYEFTGPPRPRPMGGPDRPQPWGPFAPDLGLMPPTTAGVDRGGANLPPLGIKFSPVRPIVTQEAVRHRLETGQGQLYVFAGAGMESGSPPVGTLDPPGTDQISLISPSPDARVDAKMGPFPKLFGVTAALGDAATLVVDWGCETFVNESGQNNVSPYGALLSNRWSQTQTVTEDGYTIARTEGTAVFRTDLLFPAGPGPNGAPQNPDAQRALLFMPIPQSFTRVVDYVRGRPDNSGIDYGYTDTQVPVNFVAGPFASAAKMVAVHRQAITSNVDLFGSGLAAYERVTGILLNNRWFREAGQRIKSPPGAGAAKPGGPGASRLHGGGGGP